MPIANLTEADERLILQYVTVRNALQHTLGLGVYPNLIRAIEADQALQDALAGPLADPGLLAYHETLMGPIMPYVAQLRAAAEDMVFVMRAIEDASPGTFGLPLVTGSPVGD